MDPKKEAELISKFPPQPESFKKASKKAATEGVDDVDIKAFMKIFEKAKAIEDKSGTVHTLPELVFDQEWDVLYKFKKLIGKLEGRGWETILDDVLELSDGKEKVLEIAEIIIGKPSVFIRQNFTLDRLVGLLTPFLAQIMVGKNINALLPLVMALVKNQSNLSMN